MIVFLFDLLPVELIHSIFRYLWAHEILRGFLNQNDYLDSIVNTYDRYAVSLCSMGKTEFDQICHRIQPKQVLSLAIMDDDDTPDQSALFFTYFDIRKFVNLRSFALISSDQSLFRKLDFLCEFNKFKSLVIPQISEVYWCLFGSYIEIVLPQLKRLVINEYRRRIPLTSLLHLTITHCFSYKLESLLPLVADLRSLNITMSVDKFPFWSQKLPSMIYLRQLILRIDYGRLTMGQIREILSTMPRLMHFELEIEDALDVIGGEKWKSWIEHLNLDIEESMDIIDGNQWKRTVSHLQTFDFRFYLSKIPEKQILDSFQTLFWLEQKRWFVAFDDCQSSACLFTIPRFAPKSVVYSVNYHSAACTSTELCLDQFVNTLNLPKFRPLTHDFINVTSLVLETNENLSTNHVLPFLELPRLQSLSFADRSLLIVLLPDRIFESMRVLNVTTTVSKSNIDRICTIFPRLERLQIMINDLDTMILLIDGLKYVSICKFIHCYPSSIGTLTQEWFLEHSSRLNTKDQFTVKIKGNNIHLWMSTEQNRCSSECIETKSCSDILFRFVENVFN